MSAAMESAAESAIDIRRLRSVFIINPISGAASRRARRRELIEAFVREHRLNSSIELTSKSLHAVNLARAAVERGTELIVSVGGDGTMNEVAQAVAGTSSVYGMVPAGSGNGLARDLGMKLTVEGALATLLDGRVRAIDTGSVNGHAFFNVMGLGFDAEIGRRFNASRRRGFLVYFWITLSSFFHFRKEQLTIESPGQPPQSVGSFMTAVANSTQYGNNARIAPRARLDDGRIDLTVVRTRNPLAAIVLGARLFAGSIDRSHWVTTRQAPSLRITRSAPGPIHTDGEIHECGRVLEITVAPASLKILVPRRG